MKIGIQPKNMLGVLKGATPNTIRITRGAKAVKSSVRKTAVFLYEEQQSGRAPIGETGSIQLLLIHH